MGKKATRPYFAYPTTKEERHLAYTLFETARMFGYQQPLFKKYNGSVFRWDNKGNGKYGLIDAALKAARNGRDRARRIGQSLTEADFEAAFPGKGAELYKAEHERINEIYRNANDSEDVDHIWSMNSGGFNVSNNMRPLDSVANRSEGDRGRPSPELMNANMLAESKLDQIKMQGPRHPNGTVLKLAGDGGRILLKRVNGIQNTLDVADLVAQTLGAEPGELAEVSNGTSERNGKKAEVARENGGLFGMPDLGITESINGFSLVNDKRQDI